MEISILSQKIDELVKLGKPKIAFGLLEPDDEILESLEKGKEFADIILVGDEKISAVEGFEKVIIENPNDKIAEMLVAGEVDGIIRGTIDDFKVYEKYQELTGEKSVLAPGIVEDPKGRQFVVTPISNPEGWEKEERAEKAALVADFLKSWGVEPKIAVFAAERHDTYPRKKHIREGAVGYLNKTYEDAEWIVEQLTQKGYEAKNWAIDLNPAVEDGANVIVPVSGMVGNQIFRVILFCGGKILAAPKVDLSYCYEDNSRTEKDYVPHVKWLVAMINKKKQGN